MLCITALTVSGSVNEVPVLFYCWAIARLAVGDGAADATERAAMVVADCVARMAAGGDGGSDGRWWGVGGLMVPG